MEDKRVIFRLLWHEEAVAVTQEEAVVAWRGGGSGPRGGDNPRGGSSDPRGGSDLRGGGGGLWGGGQHVVRRRR
jgi:hypothetical protein